MRKSATWDEDNECWLFIDDYDFPTLEKNIKAHFAAGGSKVASTLAGACKTGESTMYAWLDSSSQYYRAELAQVVEEYSALSSNLTDNLHFKAAAGEMKCEAKLLQNRYDRTVLNKHALKLSKATREAMATDDVKLQVSCLKQDLAKRKITLNQFSQLISSLMQSADVDIAEIKAMLQELNNH